MNAPEPRPDLVEVVARTVLRAHFLAQIVCDHERKLDFPQCACAMVDLGWHPSIGAAADAWIEHALAALSAAGALMPAGGETIEEWGFRTEHDGQSYVTPCASEAAARTPKRSFEWTLVRRTIHTGQWEDITP